MTTFDIPTLDEANHLAPLIDSLPGRRAPYLMSAGEGERYETGGQLVTVIARAEDTGGQFAAAYVMGRAGAETPFISHRDEHRFVHVTDGRLQLWLPDETHVLVPGDSAVVPAGTPYAYRMTAHRTRFLSWSSPGSGHGWLQACGRRTSSHVYDVGAEDAPSSGRATELAAEFGIDVLDMEKVDLPSKTGSRLPEGISPYVLRSGEGERWSGQRQINTYLTRSRNTDGTYFAMSTVGSRSSFIPRHFHRLHTENFLCLKGRLLLYVNGEQILLTAGDFVHAPAGTIHSFAFDAHYTQMLGLLTTGVFEKFFEYLGQPTEDYLWDEAAPVMPPAEGFAAAQAELDLQVVGPPPERR